MVGDKTDGPKRFINEIMHSINNFFDWFLLNYFISIHFTGFYFTATERFPKF